MKNYRITDNWKYFGYSHKKLFSTPNELYWASFPYQTPQGTIYYYLAVQESTFYWNLGCKDSILLNLAFSWYPKKIHRLTCYEDIIRTYETSPRLDGYQINADEIYAKIKSLYKEIIPIVLNQSPNIVGIKFQIDYINDSDPIRIEHRFNQYSNMLSEIAHSYFEYVEYLEAEDLQAIIYGNSEISNIIKETKEFLTGDDD